MSGRLAASEITAMVNDARSTTLAFLEGLDGEQLMGPMLDIVNPLLWEIGHVAWFQEHFILKRLDGRRPIDARADALYDSMRVPHDRRWELPLPTLAGTLRYMEQVRSAVLARLDGPTASETDSYFYQLATFHEDMHAEAFAYTRQTLGLPRPAFRPRRQSAGVGEGPWPGDAAIPGGNFMLGARPGSSFVFDNEKWAHEQVVEPFTIARAPITNLEFAAFVEADGYRDRTFWGDEGWHWLQAAGATGPAYWAGEPGAWRIRHFDRIAPLPPHQPVMFVNWHEANAYCAFAGRRLPTELEWEVAATGEADAARTALAQTKRSMPWAIVEGQANEIRTGNLDASFGGPVDVAAFPDGDSAFGCRQMLGNVWEWTSSDFLPYPGFSPDPYEDYSQPWFGTRKVLRGGGWMTRSRMVTPVYRNFFTPDRRDIFAGFRTCAISDRREEDRA